MPRPPLPVVFAFALAACAPADEVEPPADVSVARLVLDPSFGTDGVRTYAPGSGAVWVAAITVGADGGLVVAGYRNDGSQTLPYLARLTADGDEVLGFEPGALPAEATTARIAAATDDGGVLAILSTLEGPSIATHLLADGSVDPTYGVDGYTSLAYTCRSFLPETDGSFAFVSGRYIGWIDPDGLPDASAGDGGTLELPQSGWTEVVPDPIGGWLTYGAGAARILPGGVIDTAYGDSGLAPLEGPNGFCVAIDDGGLLCESGIRAARLDPTGQTIPTPTLSPLPGAAPTDGGPAPWVAAMDGVADREGSLVIAGASAGGSEPEYHNHAIVIRRAPDGPADLDFGDSGVLDLGFASDVSSTATAITRDGEDRVIVAGVVDGSLFLARLIPEADLTE